VPQRANRPNSPQAQPVNPNAQPAKPKKKLSLDVTDVSDVLERKISP
jgi:hypothetical protein